MFHPLCLHATAAESSKADVTLTAAADEGTGDSSKGKRKHKYNQTCMYMYMYSLYIDAKLAPCHVMLTNAAVQVHGCAQLKTVHIFIICKF